MGDRILMVTIVPPFPDDQGNRVVTRNVMDIVISCGYKIDMVLQGGYDKKRFAEHYKDHVEVVNTRAKENFRESVHMPYKQEIQQQIRKILQNESMDEYQKAIFTEMFLAANHYHPFDFLSDETVQATVRLLHDRQYDMILCNYIYSLRVVKELADTHVLPPVIVITHDSISRLNRQALEYGMNTEHRACSAPMEAECLNYADVVCCITDYERKYFLDIGVKAKCIRMEYDAYERIGNLTVKQKAFDDKIICFFASGNPLNEKGIKDFLQYCWKDIIAEEPHMKLMIIGNICEKIDKKKKYKNVTLAGKVSEEQLMEYMSKAFLSVNPVYIGTGLKIKSVDSICMGLPLVSFACGVEGLEELENIAYLKADDWKDFKNKILMLSRDRKKWEQMRVEGKAAGRKRFSKEEVYKGFTDSVKNIQKTGSVIKENAELCRKDNQNAELFVNGKFMGSVDLENNSEKMLCSKVGKGLFSKNIEIGISKRAGSNDMPKENLRIDINVG